MKKRLIPYGRQSIGREEKAAVARVMDSDWLTQGPRIAEFEQALASRLGAAHAVALSNGTAALHAMCHALELKAGDEVILSPITFAASANAVLYVGGKPVFADVDARTWNLNPDSIERLITPRTRAILAVDFAGHPCAYDALRDIAKRRALILLDDAAHALGAVYKGRSVGTLAEMTSFSFHPVKTITTGEGGAVSTASAELRSRLERFRNHGIVRDPDLLENPEGPWSYEMHDLGYNYRITDLQCAMGTVQLKKLNMFLKRRRAIAAHYTRAFQDLDLAQWPTEEKDVRSAWHLYPIRLELDRLDVSRRVIFEELRAAGLGVQVHYMPVYRHPYYQRRGYAAVHCPEAERYYAGAISLPLFPGLTEAEISRVIKTVRNTLLRHAKRSAIVTGKPFQKEEQLA